jgi:hypothetical protein
MAIQSPRAVKTYTSDCRVALCVREYKQQRHMFSLSFCLPSCNEKETYRADPIATCVNHVAPHQGKPRSRKAAHGECICFCFCFFWLVDLFCLCTVFCVALEIGNVDIWFCESMLCRFCVVGSQPLTLYLEYSSTYILPIFHADMKNTTTTTTTACLP